VIQSGSLRLDLFYRMGVVSIQLPPLRERRGGFRELVRHFIEKCNRALGQQVTDLSSRVWDLFGQYHWPGNVRELEHVIEASMNMINGRTVIRLAHLPPHIFSFSGKNLGRPDSDIRSDRAADPGSSLFETQAVNEKEMICAALTRTGGNAARAARHLGISPQSFHYKLKKYAIDRKSFIRRLGVQKSQNSKRNLL
jgi:arginine utilization regulatory protein